MFGDNHISKGPHLLLRMDYWRKVIGNHKVVLTSIGMNQKSGRNNRPGLEPRQAILVMECKYSRKR